MGVNRALQDAIDVQKSILAEVAREQLPLDWALTQNNLGAALSRLGGERESGAARLQEAVEAYRAALLEGTRASGCCSNGPRLRTTWAMRY